MLRGIWAFTWFATAWGVELDYLHRVRFSGDDRRGAAFDLMIGPTVASLHHNEGTVPAGAAVGGKVGVSLDGRLDGFVVSVGVQYRLLIPVEPPAVGAGSAEHALSGTVTAGFGFWG